MTKLHLNKMSFIWDFRFSRRRVWRREPSEI